ncbi:MAG: prolipoprotein diacylglyceryl transferase [Candidatus Eisenbacteria bacterium]
MHPEIVRIGSLTLKFYGLALMVSFLIGTQLALRRARKSAVPEEIIVWLALLILMLAVLGSRTLYVFAHFYEFSASPASVFKIWEGGLTMYGGVVLATVGGIVFLRMKGQPVWKVTDMVAPSLALGEAITRVGCFMNGCCFGTPTSLPWGVVFPEDSFSAVVFPCTRIHPSQIYSSALVLLILAYLLWREGRKRFDGELFWSYVAASASARFLVDFTRYYGSGDYPDLFLSFHFNTNQLVSAILVVASVTMMLVLRRKA